METYPPPHQPDLTLVLPFHSYYQLYHTLAGTLPPPVNDTPEALAARTHAAMDKVAAMLPTNANEADLAAQCVAMRAQADHVLRALRKHEGDIAVEMKLNAQYNAMVRTSSAVLGRLQRTQAIRYKREADGAALKADESTQYVVVRYMQQAMEAGPAPAAPAGQAAPAPAAEPPAPVPAAIAPKPASALAAAPPPAPAPAADTPPPAPIAAPAAPAPVVATPPHCSAPALAETAEQPPDLAAEAERYAILYPRRARQIRRLGGLPDDCDFGPPEPELVPFIVNGNSPALRALDAASVAAE